MSFHFLQDLGVFKYPFNLKNNQLFEPGHFCDFSHSDSSSLSHGSDFCDDALEDVIGLVRHIAKSRLGSSLTYPRSRLMYPQGACQRRKWMVRYRAKRRLKSAVGGEKDEPVVEGRLIVEGLSGLVRLEIYVTSERSQRCLWGACLVGGHSSQVHFIRLPSSINLVPPSRLRRLLRILAPAHPGPRLLPVLLPPPT